MKSEGDRELLRATLRTKRSALVLTLVVLTAIVAAAITAAWLRGSQWLALVLAIVAAWTTARVVGAIRRVSDELLAEERLRVAHR